MGNKIRAVIILITIALIGLIAIQFYWIDSAIAIKEEEFGRKVSMAMRRVVGKLERIEAMEKLKAHRMGKQLFDQRMTRIKAMLEREKEELVRYQLDLDSIKNNMNDLVRIQVVEGRSGDSVARIITRDVSSPGESTIELNIDYTNGGSDQWIVEEDKDHSREELARMLETKTEMMDGLLQDLVEFDFMKPVHERIDGAVLDSLIQLELKDALVNTDYDFGVFDYFGRPIEKLTDQERVESLYKSKYSTRLFPNDFFTQPFYLNLHFPNQKRYLLTTMWMTLTVSGLFLLIIVGAFSYTINTIVRQKKLSIIKNDFINNMTHELKTPISTISLACEALGDQDINTDESRRQKFLTMISQENKRLALLVENVLKSAIWDRGDFKLKPSEISVHQLIEIVINSVSLQASKAGGKIDYFPEAVVDEIIGDRVHLTNIIYNLLDNAIKYSGESPHVEVRTQSTADHLLISVRDHGIGIPKAHQDRIFEKFYRVPTGNVHNVKGFGLGLNYVKTIVEKHHGNLQLKSTPGKGSTFEIRLPFKPDLNHQS